MCTTLRDVASLENDDAIAVKDRSKSVCNENTGPCFFLEYAVDVLK